MSDSIVSLAAMMMPDDQRASIVVCQFFGQQGTESLTWRLTDDDWHGSADSRVRGLRDDGVVLGGDIHFRQFSLHIGIGRPLTTLVLDPPGEGGGDAHFVVEVHSRRVVLLLLDRLIPVRAPRLHLDSG